MKVTGTPLYYDVRVCYMKQRLELEQRCVECDGNMLPTRYHVLQVADERLSCIT